MSNLSARLDACGVSTARVGRYANVAVPKIYCNTMTDAERARVESVLDDIAAGKIPLRRQRSAVPA